MPGRHVSDIGRRCPGDGESHPRVGTINDGHVYLRYVMQFTMSIRQLATGKGLNLDDRTAIAGIGNSSEVIPYLLPPFLKHKSHLAHPS